jgi:hypothetical protein
MRFLITANHRWRLRLRKIAKTLEAKAALITIKCFQLNDMAGHLGR